MGIGECPTDKMLKDYLAARLEYSELVKLEEHFVRCPDCERRLAATKPPTDALVAAVRRTQSAPPSSDGPAWAAVLDGLVAIGPSGLTAIAPPFSEFCNSPCIRDYELIERLGQGGMGAVFLAIHRKLHKHVALKLVRPDHRQNPEVVARFMKEMRAIGRLEHENIVRAFDGGEHEGIHFLAMEYVAGTDLSEVLDRIGPLSVNQVCDMICQSARGLQHAHELGLIHRDVKPSNLMLSNAGKIKVLDLGLAQLMQPIVGEGDESAFGGVVGTRIYMAPECFNPNCKTGAQADIYSLGVTMLELLVGRSEIRRGALAMDTVIHRKVPTPIAPVLRRMLANSPAERPRSMAEVTEQLSPYSNGSDLVTLFDRALGLSVGETSEDTDCTREESTPVVPLAMPFHVVPPPVAAHPARQTDTTVNVSSTEETTLPVALPLVPKPLSPIPIVKQRNPMNGLRWRRAGMWSGVVVLLAVIGVTSYAGWQSSGDDHPLVTNWDEGSQVAQEAALNAPAPDATLDVRVTQPLMMKLIDEERIVMASDAGHVSFRKGINNMPPGEYTLRLTSDDLEIDLEVFDPLVSAESKPSSKLAPGSKAKPPKIVLKSNVNHLITLSGRTPHLLKPSIPEESGAFAVYEGGITIRSPIGSHRSAFKMQLQTLGQEQVEGKPHRWLKVLVYSHAHAYTETAVLLMDENAWNQTDTIVVAKGFVIAEHPDILRRLTYEHGEKQLVVPFDSNVDLLKQAAVEHDIQLPETMGAYDALAMAFGAEVPGAPAAKKLRSILAEQVTRVFDVGLKSGASSQLDCLLLCGKSADNEVPLYEIARNAKVPFSFVDVQVNSSEITGSMKLVAAGRDDKAAVNAVGNAGAYDVTKLAKSAELLKRRIPTLPIDRVQLPEKPGSLAVYSGKLGENDASYFRTKIAMLGNELIAGEEHCWLEITTESGNGRTIESERMREAARILLHRKDYDRGVFKVKQGWIVSCGMTFPFSTTTPKSITNQLLVMGETVPAGYVSSWDVLDLLFNATFGRVGNQRAEIDKAIAKAGMTRDCKVVDVLIPGSADKTDGILCSGSASGFEIATEGSKYAPWGMASIRLTSPDFGDWNAQLANTATTGGVSPYGTAANLDDQSTKTDERVKTRRLATPQHRFWTIDSTSSTEKRRIWAEFGGTLPTSPGEVSVLLCPEKAGHDDVWVEFSKLSANDQAEVLTGRAWNVDGTLIRATYRRETPDTLHLQTGEGRRIEVELISEEDRAWLDRRRQAVLLRTLKRE